MTVTIKQARILNDLSQQYMADALKIHVQTYRKIESDPEVATIRQAKMIAKLTGYPYDDIFFSLDSTKSRIGSAENNDT